MNSRQQVSNFSELFGQINVSFSNRNFINPVVQTNVPAPKFSFPTPNPNPFDSNPNLFEVGQTSSNHNISGHTSNFSTFLEHDTPLPSLDIADQITDYFDLMDRTGTTIPNIDLANPVINFSKSIGHTPTNPNLINTTTHSFEIGQSSNMPPQLSNTANQVSHFPEPMEDPDLSNFAAKDRYYRLQTKNIIIPRVIQDIEEYEREGILELFDFQGWRGLLTDNAPVYCELVRRFYANLSVNLNTGQLSSKVRGRSFTLTEDFLSEVLGIPKEGAIVQSPYEWTNQPLTPWEQTEIISTKKPITEPQIPHSNNVADRTKVIHNIVYRNIYPREPSGLAIKYCDMFILSMMLTKQRVNLPGSILRHMSAVWSKKMSLPYGGILTHVFEKIGIDLSREESSVRGIFSASLLKSVHLPTYFSDARRGIVRITDAAPAEQSDDTDKSVSPPQAQQGVASSNTHNSLQNLCAVMRENNSLVDVLKQLHAQQNVPSSTGSHSLQDIHSMIQETNSRLHILNQAVQEIQQIQGQTQHLLNELLNFVTIKFH